MPIAESLNRLMKTLLSILHNRLALASVEMEEESLRIFSAIITSLLALFCGTLAISLAVFLCIMLFWDSHRIGIMVFFIVLLASICAFLVRRVRHNYRNKPPLLTHTLAEIRKDIDT
jgi:uncharacterized membrane protein YqjE